MRVWVVGRENRSPDGHRSETRDLPQCASQSKNILFIYVRVDDKFEFKALEAI